MKVGAPFGAGQSSGAPRQDGRTLLAARPPASRDPRRARKRSMAEKLKGKRVAILVTDGFEQIELIGPRDALEAAGASTDVVSPKSGKVKGWQHVEWGD